MSFRNVISLSRLLELTVSFAMENSCPKTFETTFLKRNFSIVANTGRLSYNVQDVSRKICHAVNSQIKQDLGNTIDTLTSQEVTSIQ